MQRLRDLAVGSKIRFGKYSVNGETAQRIVWILVSKNHSSTPAYPSNSVTFLTEKIIDLRAIDGSESSDTAHNRAKGNNNYPVSNIDQWLNKDSAGGAWWVASHALDTSPNSSSRVNNMGTQYTNRPGFLNAFSEDEKNAILSTTIRTIRHEDDGDGYVDVSRKIFLPSTTEVGFENGTSYDEGAKWSYFNDNSVICTLTEQAYNNTPATTKPSSISSAWSWWLRSPYTAWKDRTYLIRPDGTRNFSYTYSGNIGIRPAMNLSDDTLVSEVTDEYGCYEVNLNTAPSKPSNLTVPNTIIGGEVVEISWEKSTDPNSNDIVYYEFQMKYNDGEWFTSSINNSETVWAKEITFGKESVQFRVRAYDDWDATSDWLTSEVYPIINNYAPTISGEDSHLGTYSDGFSIPYTISDPDSELIEVSEAIDGVGYMRYGSENDGSDINLSFDVTGEKWLRLTNGIHTLNISVNDRFGHYVDRTYTFIKKVTQCSVQNTIPMESDSMPIRIILSVARNIPSTALFLVEVCNNGYDENPIWEDATDSVKNNLVHVFENTSKTADKWGVIVRVTVDRNNADGECYISSIGGNFE